MQVSFIHLTIHSILANCNLIVPSLYTAILFLSFILLMKMIKYYEHFWFNIIIIQDIKNILSEKVSGI